MKRGLSVGLALVVSVFLLSVAVSCSKTESMKSSISGKWFRVGGHNLGKQIEFLEDGTFIDGENAGDYRFIDDNRLRIDGPMGQAIVFEVSIDKEGSLNLKGHDDEVLNYVTEKAWEERQVAEYIGTWEYIAMGYDRGWMGMDVEQKMAIISQNSKYRIIDGYGGEKPSEFFGTYKDGKIIVDGKADDFYKQQIPTLEILQNGELIYDHGAGPYKLRKLK